MTITDLNRTIDSKRRGTYRTVQYRTNSKQTEDYKVVTSVVRFVKYVPTTSVANRKPSTDKYIGHVKIHTNKDGTQSNTILFHTSGSDKHQPKVQYFNKLGQQIAKQEYELTNENHNNIDKVFCKRVEDIIWMK